MHGIRRAAGTTTLLAVSALVLSACTGSTGSTSEVSAESVTVQLDGAVTSLDPHLGASFQDVVVAWTMYDPLINRDEDGKIVEGLATKWSSTADSATFTIRDGVTCSDETKVTPAVVAGSLKRFFDPKTGAPFVSNVIGTGNSATVTADDTTVTVQLKEPFSGLLTGLASPYTGIVCPSGLKDPKSLTTESAGTGPYITASQTAGDSYVFEARDDYDWGPGYADAPTSGEMPKELTLKVVSDESTRANLQETGDLQIAGYPGDGWKRFEDGAYSITASPQSDTFLVFNEMNGHPTANPEVRKAIARSIDRERLNEVQSYGAGEIIDNLGESSYECYDESLAEAIPDQDVAAATEVLDGEKIKVMGTNILAGGEAQNYLLTSLREAGVDASLENMNNEAWISEIFSAGGDWDVTILVYGNTSGSLLSSGNFFAGDQPPAGQNLGAVKNPKATAALEEARENTGDASCAALSEFQRELIENADAIPLATVPNNVVFDDSVSAVVSKGFVRTGTIRVK